MAIVAGTGAASAGVATWTPYGPGGGMVASLAADPVKPGLVYAACERAGLYRSRDGGESWVSVDTGLEEVAAVAVDPSDGTVYVPASAEILRSDDQGNHWQRLRLPQPRARSLR